MLTLLLLDCGGLNYNIISHHIETKESSQGMESFETVKILPCPVIVMTVRENIIRRLKHYLKMQVLQMLQLLHSKATAKRKHKLLKE